MSSAPLPHDPADPRTLVARATGGDNAALSTLLETIGAEIGRELAGEIGDRWRGAFDADDVMQVSYLEAFLRIGTLRSDSPAAFAAWLRSIARNNLRDAMRKLEREARSAQPQPPVSNFEESCARFLAQMTLTTTTPSRVVRLEEVGQAVEAAMGQLPPLYERVLRLYELDGLSGEAIAAAVQRSPGAVRMLLARARERFRQVWEERDV